MAERSKPGQSKVPPPAAPQPNTAPPVPQPVRSAESVSGLTVEQAKEFHEQFKVTYTAFVGIAAVAHLLVIVWRPWF
jgi:light-harvesting complex 1 beta chain